MNWNRKHLLGLEDLSREEIIDLVISLEAGGYKLPGHLKHKHHKEK